MPSFPTSTSLIISRLIYMDQCSKSCTHMECRSVADVKRFFKTITLQFGSKWWIISVRLRIPPEGYLTISVSISMLLCFVALLQLYGKTQMLFFSLSLNLSSTHLSHKGQIFGRAKAMCAWASQTGAKYMTVTQPYLEVCNQNKSKKQINK